MQFSTIKYQSICTIYFKIECNILYLCWLSEVHFNTISRYTSLLRRCTSSNHSKLVITFYIEKYNHIFNCYQCFMCVVVIFQDVRIKTYSDIKFSAYDTFLE